MRLRAFSASAQPSSNPGMRMSVNSMFTLPAPPWPARSRLKASSPLRASRTSKPASARSAQTISRTISSSSTTRTSGFPASPMQCILLTRRRPLPQRQALRRTRDDGPWSESYETRTGSKQLHVFDRHDAGNRLDGPGDLRRDLEPPRQLHLDLAPLALEHENKRDLALPALRQAR